MDYIGDAMEKFFKDKNVPHGEIEVQSDYVAIDWISANLSYYAMYEFEETFHLVVEWWGYDGKGKLTEVRFARNV